MSKIRILPEQLTNKIAAGEVVQRPSSVVKELMENAIDAGATDILVSIVNGGKDVIRVVDNGEGMSEDDLLLAFEQHATSKIMQLDDLENIRTLGFRGEALPSIASVSMTDAQTCQKGSTEGSRLIINGGEIQSVEPVPMKPGTHVTVRRLFYNTPARRKFLKSPNTEYRHIVDTVRRFALGYPNLRFQLFSNDSEIFILEPSDLKKRIVDVFSAHYEQKLIGIEGNDGFMSLNGFVGGLDLVRKKSGEQYLFVNNRLVNDRLMNSAVYAAFTPMIEKGEYPFFVLKLFLPPQDIDVNVHPQKTEIKYRNEWQVYHFIRNSIANILKDTLRVVPSMERPPVTLSFGQQAYKLQNSIPVQQRMPLDGMPANQAPEPPILPDDHPLTRRIEQFNSNLQDTRGPSSNGNDKVVSLWQAHNKYIFAQIASAIIVIDQHAAHERILFEKALKTFTDSSAQASQQLLFPVSLELSPDDFSLLGDVVKEFENLGFSLRAFGKNTMLIEAVPADLRNIDEGQVILEILDNYRERKETRHNKTYNMAASYACKAAIKTGDALEPIEMQNLVDQLFQCESPYACPHGRPTIVNLTIDELDKRFKRT
ncbi:MAG: DNA mismatch repair endonuclease MutL [Candidatus Marinimicrobia bacterium]|nr:DNA mismatch repair endonuclease MutL [Candidatus Neomarinimicrobiota bacterium]